MAESSEGAGSGDDGMVHREVEVSSKGNVSATFRVPGMISIPSDGQAHSVTIVQLKLDASMSWISVPKEDAKTHLKVRTKHVKCNILFIFRRQRSRMPPIILSYVGMPAYTWTAVSFPGQMCLPSARRKALTVLSGTLPAACTVYMLLTRDIPVSIRPSALPITRSLRKYTSPDSIRKRQTTYFPNA